MLDPTLDLILDELRLATVKKNVVSFSKEAVRSKKSHIDFLKALLTAEQTHRFECRISRLISTAKFPVIKTLSEFDFAHIPSLNKPLILELANGHFLESKTNICLLGQTGTGKTHIATAIAYEACKKNHSVLFFSAAKLVNDLIHARKNNGLPQFQHKLAKTNLIVIDELGYIPFSKEGAEFLFQFFSDAYERQSIIVTSNLEFSHWTSFMGDSTMTSALLDRLTHHCEIIPVNGESFRFKQRKHAGLPITATSSKPKTTATV
jgi:DNA replication protein DnaC